MEIVARVPKQSIDHVDGTYVNLPASTVHTPAADVLQVRDFSLLPVVQNEVRSGMSQHLRSKMQNSGLKPFRFYAFLCSWQKSHPRPPLSDRCVSLVCGGK
jgi:hypothetical protein